MPKVRFTARFSFSPNGIDIIEYEPGPDAVEVSDRCAEVAIACEVAEAVTDDNPPAAKKAAAKKKGA